MGQDITDIFKEILIVIAHEPQLRKDLHDILKGKTKLKGYSLKQKYDVSLGRLSGILDTMMMMGIITENEKTRLLEKTSLGKSTLELMQKGRSLKAIFEQVVKLSEGR